MKRIAISALIMLPVITTAVSCRQPDELPPLKNGYETKFIIPDPTDLTPEERAVIDEMEAEYEKAVK